MDEIMARFLNRIFALLAILVVGLVIFLGAQVLLQKQSLNQQNQNQIVVSGDGKVYAKPDIATISFGVTAKAATVDAVTKNNTNKMNAVIDAIKKLGVAAKDIKTTNYNLTPVYNQKIILPTPVPLSSPDSGSVSSGSAIAMPYFPATKGSVLTGYSLEQEITVKIRDFAKIGNIITSATSNGANIADSLQFTIDNPDQYKNQAEASAITAAKANAAALAKASGIQLGKLINVQVNNYYYPMAYSTNSLKMGAGVADSAPTPTIQPGQQEIDETVNLTYQVK